MPVIPPRPETLEEVDGILHMLLEQTHGIVYRRRHEGEWRFIFVGEGASPTLGCGPCAKPCIAACNLADRISSNERHRIAQELAVLAADGATYNITYPLQGKTGSLWVRDQGRFRKDECGDLILEGVITDITRERALEAEVCVAQRMEAVGRMAGGIAHDFNNLMTVVAACTEVLLEDEPQRSERWTELHEIRKATRRAAKLTRRLLAFARQQDVHLHPLNLDETLSSIRPMLERIGGPDVNVEFQLTGEGALTEADTSLVEQIAMNLVVNACEAMNGAGCVALETRLLRAGENERAWVEWIVRDDGPGMSAQIRERVFEPFYSTKDASTGSGLGLSTVYGIVAQLGGTITLSSEVGRGSSFRILLPVVDGPIATKPIRPPLTPIEGVTRLERLGNETILVVDDEAPVRRIVGRILRRAGYTVLEAEGSIEATEISRSHAGPIHLLLTDVLMPDGSGTSLAARLREEREDLRVLYISGYAGPRADRGSQIPPPHQLLEKPFTTAALRDRVRFVLEE